MDHLKTASTGRYHAILQSIARRAWTLFIGGRMSAKINFVWSRTPDDSHQGVVYVHDEEGELAQLASPTGGVNVRPGRYRLQVHVAGRVPAISESIVVSDLDRNVDLDEILGQSSADSKPKPVIERVSRLRRTWQVETWTGNLMSGECRAPEPLGRWDGRFPVTLSGQNQPFFVRISAADGTDNILIAVPASNGCVASLLAKSMLSDAPVDDRDLMDVVPQNPAVRMLLSLLETGGTSDALLLAPQIAAELLDSGAKKKDPIAAAISCYFLLDAIRRDDDTRKLWPTVSKAVERLSRYEEWMPDSAVLAAHVATLEERYADAAARICRLETCGPPIVTSGLTKAIELLRVVMGRLGSSHPEFCALDRTLSRLVPLCQYK